MIHPVGGYVEKLNQDAPVQVWFKQPRAMCGAFDQMEIASAGGYVRVCVINAALTVLLVLCSLLPIILIAPIKGRAGTLPMSLLAGDALWSANEARSRRCSRFRTLLSPFLR